MYIDHVYISCVHSVNLLPMIGRWEWRLYAEMYIYVVMLQTNKQTIQTLTYYLVMKLITN
jgi:hypothetical protein